MEITLSVASHGFKRVATVDMLIIHLKKKQDLAGSLKI